MPLEALSQTFNNLISQAGSFLLNLLAAIVVLIIGWIVASSLGKGVEFLLDRLQVDEAFQRLGLDRFFKDLGFKKGIVSFLGWVVKWFLIVVVLIAVAESLGLPQISNFINQVSLYIPNVIAAAVILIIGVFIADALSQAVYRSAEAARLAGAELVRTVTRWAILIFTFLAVLSQLRLAQGLIEILFTGLVAALALASGLAFGLGGQEKAKEWLDKFSESFKRK